METSILEESRAYLSSFMVRCFYERGSFETLEPSLFFLADVMKSIGRQCDPLSATVTSMIFMYDGDTVTVSQQHRRNVQRKA